MNVPLMLGHKDSENKALYETIANVTGRLGLGPRN